MKELILNIRFLSHYLIVTHEGRMHLGIPLGNQCICSEIQERRRQVEKSDLSIIMDPLSI